MKFTQAEIKNISQIYQKIDFILAGIPQAMYGMELKELLRSCNHDAILDLVNTIYDLYSDIETAHCYIWDVDTFKNYLKKIQSKSIKKDMSSSTYKSYVENIIDSCYPSAHPYFGLMIVLNTDYHTDWRDIFNYFYLCEFRPQYRELYRLRPPRQVKVYKALTDNMVTRTLTYSGYSKNTPNHNFSILTKNRELFQSFIHILCGLQVLREEYQFFDKRLLEEVIDDYWRSKYDRSLTEYDRRAIKAIEDIKILETTISNAENTPKDSNGKMIQAILKDQVKELKQFLEQYKEDYEAQIQYIYNGFGNKSDINPTDEQCNALWQTYRHTNDVLLNSIAVLVHKYDSNRIIAYYAVRERRIMLAEYGKWKFDMDSGDPYIIYPKLQRPIDDNLVKGLKFIPQYRNATAEQIDNEWEKDYKSDLRQALMFIIYGLQSSGAEIIRADIFSEAFKRQIENDKNGGSYIGVELEMIHVAIKSILDDKKDVVCRIAILLDMGYDIPEVGNFFHTKILG